MEPILCAVVEGEIRLVEEVGGLLFDRASGELLDPAVIVLIGVDPSEVAAA